VKPRLEEWIYLHYGIHLGLPGYLFMFALSLTLGCWVFLRYCRHRDLSLRYAYTFLCLALPLLLGGSKVVYWLQFPSSAQKGTEFWLGPGAALYGGFLGVLVAAVLTAVWYRSSFAPYVDGLALSLSAGLITGRIGCFLAGCNFGRITELPWGVRFPAGSHAFRQHLAAGLIPESTRLSLAVHPTQLYEVGTGLVLFGVGMLLLRRTRSNGVIFGLLAAAYAVFRFLVEYVRADQGGTYWAGYTFAQLVSVLIVTALVTAFVLSRLRSEREEVLRVVGPLSPSASRRPRAGPL
jgi:phosphatidylglycerol:prolipoprotein diacylglycerol transferase